MDKNIEKISTNSFLTTSFSRKTKQRLDPKWIHTISGATGGLIAGIIVCNEDFLLLFIHLGPLDVVKIRLQNQGKSTPAKPPKYIGTFKTLSTIWQQEGLKGWYRGLGATAVAYIVDRAIWFPLYYTMKSTISQSTKLDTNHYWVHLSASVGTSLICLVTTNPLWIIRTRIMV